MTDPVVHEPPRDEAVRLPVSLAWQVPITLGVLHLALGAALLLWPEATIGVAVVLLGIELVFGGVLRLVGAIATHGEARMLRAVVGVLGVLAGILVVREPLRSVGLVVLVLGAFWVVWGLVEALVALTPAAAGHRGPLLVEAAFGVVAGGVLLAWPGPTLRVLTVLVGILLVLAGLLATWAGTRIRSVVREAATDPGRSLANP